MACLSAALLAGCVPTTVVRNPDITPTTEGLPAPQKKALHAGIYYSPDFANYQPRRRLGNLIVNGSALAPASMKYLDEVYARVFEKTTRVTDLSPASLAGKGIDVVVAPSFEHFDVDTGAAPVYPNQYGLAYRTTLSTVEGVPVASWVTIGTQDYRKMQFMTWGQIIEAYMADAGRNLLNGFDRDSEAGLRLLALKRSNAVDAPPVNVAVQRAELPRLEKEQAERLQRAGVVALQVSATSRAEQTVVMRASDMRLRLKDGQTLQPAALGDVITIMQSGSTAGFGSLLGPIGMAMEAMAAGAASESEKTGLHGSTGQTLFRDRLLARDKEEAGVVFFQLPEDVKAGDGMRLGYWVVDPATGNGAQRDLGIATTPSK